MIEVAADAGADAVKFQTFKASKLATPAAATAAYQAKHAKSQRELLERLELSADAHRELRKHCEHKGIMFLSTPFEEESADFLDQLGIAAFKIPSGEVTNLTFLGHIARKKKPVILSTGMSILAEVEAAVRVIRDAGNAQIVLLQCTSNYPADPADANLRAMRTMAQ